MGRRIGSPRRFLYFLDAEIICRTGRYDHGLKKHSERLRSILNMQRRGSPIGISCVPFGGSHPQLREGALHGHFVFDSKPARLSSFAAALCRSIRRETVRFCCSPPSSFPRVTTTRSATPGFPVTTSACTAPRAHLVSRMAFRSQSNTLPPKDYSKPSNNRPAPIQVGIGQAPPDPTVR